MRLVSVACCWIAALIAAPAAAPQPCADTVRRVELPAVMNNVVYSDNDNRANGAGDFLLVGRVSDNDGGSRRRMLLQFPTVAFTTVPESATLLSASLNLFMSDTEVGSRDVAAHRVTRQWGEGLSTGGPASAGDATWLYSQFPSVNWTVPGGDFEAGASATVSVSSTGPYSWSGSGVLQDVELWRSGAQPNYGWMLVGDEIDYSTKEFRGRHNALTPPSLVVTYSLPGDECAGPPPAYPSGGSYPSAAACAGAGPGTTCALQCDAGTTPEPPEGACCQLGTWRVATCEAPCGAGRTRRALQAAADTTVFSENGSLANGGGSALFVGYNSRGDQRRALLRFDLSPLLDDAEAASRQGPLSLWRADLRLVLNRSGGMPDPVSLYRLEEDWGEGASASVGGSGAPAMPGDATWTQRFFEQHDWEVPGGTALPLTLGAAQAGSAAGTPWVWGGAGLLDDALQWALSSAQLNHSASHQGWLAVMPAPANASAPNVASFLSREADDPYSRPRLVLCSLLGYCAARAALYFDSGGEWVPAEQSCGGGGVAPHSYTDCELRYQVCLGQGGSQGAFNVMSGSLVGPTRREEAKGNAFPLIMGVIGGVIVAGLLFIAWTWLRTRHRKAYELQHGTDPARATRLRDEGEA